MAGRPRSVSKKIYERVFHELLEGKPRKLIAYDNNVSMFIVQRVLEDFPLFFGLRRRKPQDDE